MSLFKKQSRADWLKDVIDGIVCSLKAESLTPTEMKSIHDDTKKEFYKVLLSQRENLSCEIHNLSEELKEVNEVLDLIKNES